MPPLLLQMIGTKGSAGAFACGRAVDAPGLRADPLPRQGLLYSHVIKSAESTALMLGEDGEGGLAGLARIRLERETSAKRATGVLTPTAF